MHQISNIVALTTQPSQTFFDFRYGFGSGIANSRRDFHTHDFIHASRASPPNNQSPQWDPSTVYGIVFGSVTIILGIPGAWIAAHALQRHFIGHNASAGKYRQPSLFELRRANLGMIDPEEDIELDATVTE